MDLAVSALLTRLGLDRFLDKFRENEVDAWSLPMLTPEDLTEMGIPIGPRRRILEALAAERQQQADGVALTAAPTPAPAPVPLPDRDEPPVAPRRVGILDALAGSQQQAGVVLTAAPAPPQRSALGSPNLPPRPKPLAKPPPPPRATPAPAPTSPVQPSVAALLRASSAARDQTTIGSAELARIGSRLAAEHADEPLAAPQRVRPTAPPTLPAAPVPAQQTALRAPIAARRQTTISAADRSKMREMLAAAPPPPRSPLHARNAGAQPFANLAPRPDGNEPPAAAQRVGQTAPPPAAARAARLQASNKPPPPRKRKDPPKPTQLVENPLTESEEEAVLAVIARCDGSESATFVQLQAEVSLRVPSFSLKDKKPAIAALMNTWATVDAELEAARRKQHVAMVEDDDEPQKKRKVPKESAAAPAQKKPRKKSVKADDATLAAFAAACAMAVEDDALERPDMSLLTTRQARAFRVDFLKYQIERYPGRTANNRDEYVIKADPATKAALPGARPSPKTDAAWFLDQAYADAGTQGKDLFKPERLKDGLWKAVLYKDRNLASSSRARKEAIVAHYMPWRPPWDSGDCR